MMASDSLMSRLNERACFALQDANIVVKSQAEGLVVYQCRTRVCGVPLLISGSSEIRRFATVAALETFLDESIASEPELRELDRLSREACQLYDDPLVTVRKVKEGTYVIRHRECVRRTNVLKLRYNDCNYIPHNAYVDRASVRQHAYVDHVSTLFPTPAGFGSLSAIESYLRKRATYNEKQRIREAELTDFTNRACRAYPDRRVRVVRGKREIDRGRFLLVFTDTNENRELQFNSIAEFETLLTEKRKDVGSAAWVPAKDGGYRYCDQSALSSVQV